MKMPKVFQNSRYLSLIAFRLLAEEFDEPLGDHLAQLAHQGVVLQRLAGDVERQVLGIDHPFEKAQPFRQDIFAVLIDQHLLAVEIDAGLHPAHAQDLEILLGHIDQGIDGQRRIGGKMQAVQRLVGGIADELVEIRYIPHR